MSFKENLRKYRIAAGYTQVKDFAENTLHMKYTTYLSYENRGSWPDEDTLVKICNVLDVTPNELLDFEFKKDRQKRIKELCKNCGIDVDFTKNDLVVVGYIEEISGFQFPSKFTMPLKDFDQLLSDAFSSPQYYFNMRYLLINALAKFGMKKYRIELKNMEKWIKAHGINLKDLEEWRKEHEKDNE